MRWQWRDGSPHATVSVPHGDDAKFQYRQGSEWARDDPQRDATEHSVMDVTGPKWFAEKPMPPRIGRAGGAPLVPIRDRKLSADVRIVALVEDHPAILPVVRVLSGWHG